MVRKKKTVISAFGLSLGLSLFTVFIGMGRPDYCGVIKERSDVCKVECSESGIGPEPEDSSKVSENRDCPVRLRSDVA